MRFPSTLSTVPTWTPSAPMTSICSAMFCMVGSSLGTHTTRGGAFPFIRDTTARQLQETPIFQEIRARGQMTTNPWKEAFLSSNIKYIGIPIVVLSGQGVVWYSGQFWALYFLQQVSKALSVAGNGHAARQHQLSDRDLHH